MTDAVVFVGIDWATSAHQVCVVDRQGCVVGERSVPHTADDLARMCDWLVEAVAGDPSAVWVAIEVPRGPVVETLLGRGLTVYSINPKQLDRFRDRFSVAGCKDDRLDARVLADSLRTDGRHFRELAMTDPVVIELREWTRYHDDLKGQRVRLCNQLRDPLRRDYPQAVEVNDDLGDEWFLELWLKVPTPSVARTVREATIATVLKANRIRKITAAEVLARLRQPALRVAPGTVEAASAHIRMLVPHLRLVNEQIRDCERRVDALLEALAAAPPTDEGQPSDDPTPSGPRDPTILRSMPGVGRVVLSTLLAEAPEAIRDRDYAVLRALAGVAPVTRSSGKSRHVIMRYACHPQVREAVFHWARTATQSDADTRAAYAAHRAHGHTHGRALRGVADRLLAVACAMLRDRTCYDPSRRRPQAAA